ncbi:MAG: cation transporting ATPase C-terminal domain-containing protein [Christensenellales bacterium]
MGSGTEVAKEAGDIVILDDNFSSIAKAILYGRTIFKSIRKFIVFQLTMNLCAVGVSVFGPMLGVDTPVTVVQMLWVNMIMDTLGGLAFAGEAPLKEYMKEPPKRRDEPILNRYMVNQILITGLSTMGLCLFFLKSDKIRSLFCYQSDPLYSLRRFSRCLSFAAYSTASMPVPTASICFPTCGKTRPLYSSWRRYRAAIGVYLLRRHFVPHTPLPVSELGFTLPFGLPCLAGSAAQNCAAFLPPEIFNPSKLPACAGVLLIRP